MLNRLSGHWRELPPRVKSIHKNERESVYPTDRNGFLRRGKHPPPQLGVNESQQPAEDGTKIDAEVVEADVAK